MLNAVEPKYTLEELERLPLEDQAIICFLVAKKLFRQNKGMLAVKFMQKALSINPSLLFDDNLMDDNDEEEGWFRIY